MMLEMDLHSHLRRALGPAARTYQNLPEPARNLPEPARRNLNLSEPAWEVRKASFQLSCLSVPTSCAVGGSHETQDCVAAAAMLRMC